MSAIEIYELLLKLSEQGRFSAIRELPEAGDPESVQELTSHSSRELVKWLSNLNSQQKAAFAKAVAVLEDSVGGLGSVTSIDMIISENDEFRREALNWIIKETNAYKYFSGTAKSVEELEERAELKLQQSAERKKKEALRRVGDRRRREIKSALTATKATKDLPNAIKRGDIRAVCALLDKGADSTVCGPDGVSMIEMAESIGQVDIAKILRASNDPKSGP